MNAAGMSVFKAVGQGFKFLPRLWMAFLVILVMNAVAGALATVALPFEVVDGQLRVPPVTTPEEAAARFFPALGLYLFALGYSLFLLGGVFSGLSRLIKGSPLSVAVYFQSAARWFFPMVRWGLAFMGVTVGSGIAASLLVGLLWGVTGRTEAMQALIQPAFSMTLFVVGLVLVFSPVIFVDRFLGVGKSFSESYKFLKVHKGATLGLLLLVGFIGALAWTGGLILAGIVNGIRDSFGIAQFAPGWPVFFFSLILGLPQAFVTVFFPTVLYSYYTGKSYT